VNPFSVDAKPQHFLHGASHCRIAGQPTRPQPQAGRQGVAVDGRGGDRVRQRSGGAGPLPERHVESTRTCSAY
jgi:hypothetical protein